MIKDKLPKDLNYVPPTNVIIESIEDLEKFMQRHGLLMTQLSKKVAILMAQVESVQKDFDLIKKYVE